MSKMEFLCEIIRTFIDMWHIHQLVRDYGYGPILHLKEKQVSEYFWNINETSG